MGERRLQYSDVIGAAFRIVFELEIGRDRLGRLAAQIHRIEIELQPKQQRQASRDRQQRHDQDRHAMPFQETVDRRQHGVTEMARLPRALARKALSQCGEVCAGVDVQQQRGGPLEPAWHARRGGERGKR